MTTALGGEYKAEQNRCRELGVLPKFQSKTVLKIHEYLMILKGRKTSWCLNSVIYCEVVYFS